MKHKKFCSLVVGMLACKTVFGGGVEPQLVNTAGGSVRGNQLSVDFSIGETATFGVGGFTIGFLQPVPKPTGPLSILSEKSIGTSTIYPNPVVDRLFWKADGKDVARINVTSLQGETILELLEPTQGTSIQMLNPGIYYATLVDGENGLIGSFKIVKQ